MALISNAAKLWPGGIVPFVIDQDMNQEQKDVIKAGIGLVTNFCQGVTFVGHSFEPSWVHFIVYHDPGGLGSESAIGMPSGVRIIWVSSDIRSGGEATIAHEICHALGLLHEVTRSDQHNFVSINFSNINVIHQDQFKSNPHQGPSDFGAYDKASIMHYRRRDYAINPSIDTITPLAPSPPLVVTPPTTPVPQSQDFSGFSLTSGDIAAIKSLYPPSAPFGESSDAGPALAAQDDTVVLGVKGKGNARLSTLTSSNGNAFFTKSTLTETSTNAPALAVHNSKFVMAWTGETDNKLNVMQSSDGSNWHSKVTLSDTSPSAPALAHVGAEIFLAWRGGDNRLNLLRSFDGNSWRAKQTIGETTDSGPALSSSGPNLLLVWRGRGNNNINIISSAGGIIVPGPGGVRPPGFSKVTLGDTTDDRPAICRTGSHVYLAWQGGGNGLMNVMKSTDGTHWSDKITVNAERMAGGPAIVSWNHVLVRAWKETASPGHLRSRAFSEF
jgi:Astacin (Peptidase family M12A)